MPIPISVPNHLPKPIHIIGAGVLGLSTALRLQKILPKNTPLSILASEFPNDTNPSPDYASAWAGAHYRPIPVSSPQLHREMEWGQRTAMTMRALAAEHGPEIGVADCKGVEYLEEVPNASILKKLRTGDVYAGEGDGFRVFEAGELPKGVAWGCEYEAYTVNVPVYCSWLLERFRAAGGRVLKCKLEDAEDAFKVGAEAKLGEAEIVVNCSGRNFDKDPLTKVIRGQTVLVKNPYDKTVTRQCQDGSWAFLVPRPLGGGTIVGGTKEIGDMTEEASPETRRKLLEASVKCFPEFVADVNNFEVVRDNVGRRPWREGGVRTEIEKVDGGRKYIVHGYGAGGRGYETSWGIAESLGELVQELVSK